LENLSQKSANYVLCSEKIFKRVWDTSQQAKSVRKPQAKTDGFTEKGTLFLCLLRNLFFFPQSKVTTLAILFEKT